MTKYELATLMDYMPDDATDIVIGGAGARLSFSSATVPDAGVWQAANQSSQIRQRPGRTNKFRWVEIRKE